MIEFSWFDHQCKVYLIIWGGYMKLICRSLIVYCSLLSLTACDPPYSIQVTEFNEKGFQQPAAITISDPQVFSRESLINDRLREAELLDKLLEDSAKDEFRATLSTPQLLRNVESLTGIAASATAKFDPASGATAEAAGELNEKKLANDKLRLDIVEAQLKTIQEKVEKGEALTAEEQALLDAASEFSADPITAGDELSTITGRLDTAKTELEEALGRLTVAKAQGDLSPIESFRGLQAYRALLRQARAEVNLDDLHDADGNQLFRFHAKVGVFPGKNKDKMGILRLTVAPPEWDENGDDLWKLYSSWLNHVAFRLNQPLPVVRKGCPVRDKNYARLIGAGLFEVAVVSIRKREEKEETKDGKEEPKDTKNIKEKSGTCTVYIPYPPDEFDQYKDTSKYLDKEMYKDKSKEEVKENNKESVQNTAAENWLKSHISGILLALSYDSSLEIGDEIVIGPDQIILSLANQINGLGFSPNGKSSLREALPIIMSRIADSGFRPNVPQKFKDVVTKNEGNPQGGYEGHAYAYAVLPAKDNQISSTVASRASSLELALSLAADLASTGAVAQGQFGAFSQVAGKVEALETNPLVVGFASRDSTKAEQTRACSTEKKKLEPICANDAHQQLPQVGWVFGPRARIDAQKSEIKLIHAPEHHDVAADLSLPGWWPYVTVKVETAWIGNWHNSAEMIRKAENMHGKFEDEFKRPLPRGQADFDGLTEFLAANLIGKFPTLLSIRDVQPFFLSACEDEVTLRVTGSNVWRGTKVFLGGAEGEEIGILPDMQGVQATFKIADMFKTENSLKPSGGFEQHVPLTVWTQNGSETIALPFKGSRTKEGCRAATSLASTTRSGELAIVRASPTEVDACGKVSFGVKLAQIDPDSTELRFLLDGKAPKTPKMMPVPREGSVYELNFENVKAKKGENRPVVLTANDGYSIASTPIELRGCSQVKVAKAKTSTKTAAKLPKLIKHYINTATVAKDAVSFVYDLDPNGLHLAEPDIRIAVRTVSATGKRSPRILSPGRPTQSGLKSKVATARFEITKKAQPSQFAVYEKEVLTLEFEKVKVDSKGKVVSAEALKGAVIFYPKKGDDPAEIVATPSTFVPGAGPPWKIKLQFKEKAADALDFPGLTGTKLSAKIEEDPTIILTVSPETLALNKDTASIEVKVDGDPVNQAKFKALTTYSIDVDLKPFNVPAIPVK